MGERSRAFVGLRRWTVIGSLSALAFAGPLALAVPAHAEPGFAHLTGSVLGVDDAPLSGIAVHLVDADSGEIVEVPLSGGVRGLPPEANGNYGSESVPPGDYLLLFSDASLARSAEAESYATGYLADATTGGTVPTVAGAERLTLEAGDVLEVAAVHLEVGGAIAGGAYVIAPSGQAALSGARVEHVRPNLFLHTGGDWHRVFYDSPYFGDDSGRYVMSGLPSGEYCLFFDMKTGRGAYAGNIKFEPTYRGGTSCDDADLVAVTAGRTTSGIDTELTYQEPSDAAVAVADFASDAEEGSLAVSGSLVQGERIAVEVGPERVGEWVSAFAHSTPTALGGWYRIDVDGTVTVPVPADAPTGAHSLVVQDADGTVLGWDAVTIAEAPAGPSVIVRDTPVTIPAAGGQGVTGSATLELTSASGVTAVILPGTTITSSDASWDGTLTPPTVVRDGEDRMPTSISGAQPTVALAIEVGDPGSSLTLDQPVRLLLPGQAGKHAGFIPVGGSFTPISTPCVADTPTAATGLPAAGDCVISVGGDLVIWTKHFTVFLAYGLGALPATGADPGPWAIGAAVLLLIGAAVVLATRMSRRAVG